jgi:hypothetical protein
MASVSCNAPINQPVLLLHALDTIIGAILKNFNTQNKIAKAVRA